MSFVPFHDGFVEPREPVATSMSLRSNSKTYTLPKKVSSTSSSSTTSTSSSSTSDQRASVIPVNILDSSHLGFLFKKNPDDVLSDIGEALPFPFTTLMNAMEFPVPFKHRRGMLPFAKLSVAVVFHRFVDDKNDPFEYQIFITHGPFDWTIFRQCSHFRRLVRELQEDFVWRRVKFVTFWADEGKPEAIPHCPNPPDSKLHPKHSTRRAEEYQTLLGELLSLNIAFDHPAVLDFLGISVFSCVGELGMKLTEGFVMLRSYSVVGTKAVASVIANALGRPFFELRKRWMVLKDSFVTLIDPLSGKTRMVILVDNHFSVKKHDKTLLALQNNNCQVLFGFKTQNVAEHWLKELSMLKNCEDYAKPNRYGSSYPTRTAKAAWFVDGGTFMETVADAIEDAREQVFITDWYISPELFLKRRPRTFKREEKFDPDYWRLDFTLKRAAHRGVHIFILIYHELRQAMDLASSRAAKLFRKLHKNIHVIRHPQRKNREAFSHWQKLVFFWANHEKSVIVDQNFAFVGGLDLCYGRWDTREHWLTDIGEKWCSVRTLKQLPSEILNQPEDEPITAVIVQKLKETVMTSLTETFAQLQDQQGYEQNRMFSAYEDFSAMGDAKKKGEVADLRRIRIDSSSVGDDFPEDFAPTARGCSLWPGKDFANNTISDFKQLGEIYAADIDRSTKPRMPWHDVAVMVEGLAARDVARHFIERWNHCKARYRGSFHLRDYPLLIPKSVQPKTGEESEETERKRLFKPFTLPVKVQLVRSASKWSAGTRMTEASIQEAYKELISQAEFYIYIENQFFISLATKEEKTANGIGDAIFDRIHRAHRREETFKVYIILPLLPAFPGKKNEIGAAAKTITLLNLSSLSRGPNSLIGRLKAAGVSRPEKYIGVYSLRTHSELPNGQLTTELIYVHSKLMIIDDKKVLCGSANINDRSLMGFRDSELAFIIEDESKENEIQGRMNGKLQVVGKFASSLRKQLFGEHLGQLKPSKWNVKGSFGQESHNFNLDDPISPEFWRAFNYIAKKNTEIYEAVFRCIPRDSVRKLADLAEDWDKPMAEVDKESAREELKFIQGHLVEFPLKFLEEEEVGLGLSNREYLLPAHFWT